MVLFKIHMMSYKRLIKILKCNLMLFGQAPPSLQTTMKFSQVSVKTCDEEVAQENDQLKLEVKRLEKMVSELVKQIKVRPQDNLRNMVNKLVKGSNFTKQASQQSRKAQLLKKQQNTIEEETVEYARSAYMNERRPHIKNGLGYKMGDKHNSRVNNNGKKFIKFTKDNSHQVKQDNKATNMFLILMLMLLACLIMLLMHLMFS
jgi:hypothetical protein